MATEDSNISEVNKKGLSEVTSCCICTDLYTDPKLLPCNHTFCMNCIQETGLKISKIPGDEMPCPICRQQFKIPLEGFNGLPNNSFIEKLIQVENILDQSVLSRDVALCDACLEDIGEETTEQIPSADSYCVECKQRLCDECCRHHRKLKLTKYHKLVPIEELHKSSESVKSNLVSCACELHEQKVLDVYCVKCNVVVCAICFIDEHRNHEGSHVSKFVNVFRQQIELHTGSMTECISQVQEKQSELLKLKEDMQQNVERLELNVVNRKYEMKQLVDVHAHSILQRIDVLQRYKLKEIEIAAGEIDAYLSVLDSFKTSCQKVAQGTPSHICRSVSDLSARAAELQQQCHSLVEQDIESFKVCFKKLEFEEFLHSEGGNFIGEIVEERNPKSKESSKGNKKTIKELEASVEKLKQDLNSEKATNKALQAEIEKLRQQLDVERKSNKDLKLNVIRPTKTKIAKTAGFRYMSNPVLVQTVGTRAAEKNNKLIRGVAILDKELFVVNRNSSEVEVYDLLKLSFSRRWNLKDLSGPQDMGSCKKNKCLYIIDHQGTSQSNQILNVYPNGKLINKWSTGDDFGWGLSVTDESNVILTVHGKNKLNEYSPDGQFIRAINLSSVAGILNPWLAIKLANGHFIVSHGHGARDPHGVCVVDAGGNLKKSFGGKPGSTIENMHQPVYMAIDGNGFVMVVDRRNSRILLLDSDLQFQREILSKEEHGLRDPMGICLDETNCRLLVVDRSLKPKNKLYKDYPIAVFDF